MKCFGCGGPIDSMYIQTCDDDKFCQEVCMHDVYTEHEIEWLFDKELAWWQTYETFDDDTYNS